MLIVIHTHTHTHKDTLSLLLNIYLLVNSLHSFWSGCLAFVLPDVTLSFWYPGTDLM